VKKKRRETKWRGKKNGRRKKEKGRKEGKYTEREWREETERGRRGRKAERKKKAEDVVNRNVGFGKGLISIFYRAELRSKGFVSDIF